MPVLSAADILSLQDKPVGRRTKFYVYQPADVWTGTVGGAPDRGDRSLTVATVGGNPANIRDGCTVWVRDSTGALKDYPSKVRFRSYGAPTMVVADNDIDWAAGDLLSAKRLFEIWPRIVYIDPADGTQYKDRDVAYVNDATAQPPKANAGPMAIADLVGGQADVIFADEGSFAVPAGGAVASEQWGTFGGAPAVVGGAEASPTVTYRYTTAGYYYVSYTVTDGNGITGIRWVPVIIDDGSLDIVDTMPVDRNYDGRGWVMGQSLLGLDADDSLFYDGAPCALVADTQQTASNAFADNRSNLRWSGWLMEDRTTTGFYNRRIIYRAVSSAHVTEMIPAFPVGVRTDVAPANWYELSALNLDSTVFHLLKWQSTVLEVCDYHGTGEWGNRTRPGENCRSDSLLRQVNDVLHACFANMRCDRQGVLRAIRNEWHLSAAERAARATAMTLSFKDYQNIQFGPRQHRATVRETRLLGVNGADTPFIAGSPGDAPLDGGRPLEVQKLAPLNQTELNRWAGQELSFRNWAWPLKLTMAGEYDGVDPAFGEYVAGALSAFDSKLPDGPYSVQSVRFSEDRAGGMTMGEWTLLPDPGQAKGATRAIPVEPDPPAPDDPPDDPPYDPPVPAPEWPLVLVVATEGDASEGTVGEVYVTSSFSGPGGTQPTWTQQSATGLPATRYIQYINADPDDRQNKIYVLLSQTSPTEETDRELWYSANAGTSFTKIMDSAIANAELGLTGEFRGFGINETNGNVIVGWREDGGLGAGLESYVGISADNGATWPTWTVCKSGGWHHDCSLIRASGSTIYVGGRWFVAGGPAWAESTDGGASFFDPVKAVGISQWTPSPHYNANIIDMYLPVDGGAEGDDLGIRVNATTYAVVRDADDIPPQGMRKMWLALNEADRMWLLDPTPIIHYTDDAWASMTSGAGMAKDIGGIGWCGEYDMADDFMRMILFNTAAGNDAFEDPESIFATIDWGATLVNKSGTNYNTPPYTDAIPSVEGGLAGVIVIDRDYYH